MKKYRTMSGSDIKICKKNLKVSAESKKKFGLKNIQSDRFMRDSVSGSLVGVTKMNLELHGWDGEFDNGTPFENKNITSSAKTSNSYALKLQDTSAEKLQEMTSNKGALAEISFWGDADEPDFCLIGNTLYVADLLQKSYNPETRKSCQASFLKCLDRGFKIVAVNYDKVETIDTISRVFPRLGSKLTVDDVYTKQEMVALAETMI